MPCRYLHTDEWYPVLFLNEDEFCSDGKAEFNDDELTEIQRVTRDFHIWQAKIAERFGIKAPSPSFQTPGAADL
jgi:hypothetical protein